MDEFPSGRITVAWTLAGFPPEVVKQAIDAGFVPGTELQGITFKNRLVVMDWLGITAGGRLDKTPDGRWRVRATFSAKWADQDVVLLQPTGLPGRADVTHDVLLNIVDNGEIVVGNGAVPVGPGRIEFSISVQKDREEG